MKAQEPSSQTPSHRRDPLGRLKVLIIGGYGTFGGRLAQLLADEGRLTLVVAGRSKARAANFCAGLIAKAELLAIAFDRDGDIAAQLNAITPDVVVDASGPFQSYGEDPYRVARAAMALGIHYLDLADDAAFVKGIARLDPEARAHGVFVLSGVSTCPALTAAAVRHLARDFSYVSAISGGIAPSPYAGLGLNVIRAITNYAGKPIGFVRDGKQAIGHALTETRRYTIAPPGRLGLKNIRFSLIDVPDLALLPEQWPNLNSIWFGVGPVPESLHRILNAMVWLVRLKILPTLSPLAAFMHRFINHVRWGEHRSGMFVNVEGVRDGLPVERSWHLVAERDDGPFIPAMAAEAIIRGCLDRKNTSPGARPATNELELPAYEALFARKQIFVGCREISATTAALPLYRRLLGDAWASLPPPLQRMHDLNEDLVAKGRATVARGRGILARLIAAIVGFPPDADDIPVEVLFQARRGREYWRRNFVGHAFLTTQEAGRGRFEQLVCERFGPCCFGMALVIDGNRLRLVLRRWSIFGVPLPVRWAPFGDIYEHVDSHGDNTRFCFHVEIKHPLTGLIVHYRGWLVPQASAMDSARQMPSNPALVSLGVEN